MNNIKDFFITHIIVIIGIFSFVFSIYDSNSNQQNVDLYKQGQIDAINGKIYYELKENPDGSSEWRYIEK